jgi:hypothetical protein
MAEPTAFVFCMNIGSAQPAVCRSNQDMKWRECLGGGLVHQALRVCVVTYRPDFVSRHSGLISRS